MTLLHYGRRIAHASSRKLPPPELLGEALALSIWFPRFFWETYLQHFMSHASDTSFSWSSNDEGTLLAEGIQQHQPIGFSDIVKLKHYTYGIYACIDPPTHLNVRKYAILWSVWL